MSAYIANKCKALGLTDMAQHFRLSAKARPFFLATVLRRSDEEVEATLRRIRWTDGKPVFPHCECPTVYDCRKADGAPRWRCQVCRKDVSVTSGTLFAFHRMPLRFHLAAIAICCPTSGSHRPEATSAAVLLRADPSVSLPALAA